MGFFSWLFDSPVSDWSEKDLVKFIDSDVYQRLHALRIASLSDPSKEKQCRELENKVDAVVREIERRRSMPLPVTEADRRWLSANADLISRIAKSKNIEIEQAKEVVMKERQNVARYLIGRTDDKKTYELLLNKFVESRFEDKK